MIIAPAGNQIDLMKELMSTMRPPYWILYVLLVSRIDAAPGRYQASMPLSADETEVFLDRFSEFFERDGRHHLCVGGENSQDLLVYDNHNVIYAYGDLPKFERVLSQHGMRQIESVRFPCPHSHHYNVEFDRSEEEILRFWNWRYFPLQDSDDL